MRGLASMRAAGALRRLLPGQRRHAPQGSQGPFREPRLGCCSARRLTVQAVRKGLTVDDTTLRYCAGRIPKLWPNADSKLTSLRIFQAWNIQWPAAERKASWRGLSAYIKAQGIQVLVGAPVTCPEPQCDPSGTKIMSISVDFSGFCPKSGWILRARRRFKAMIRKTSSPGNGPRSSSRSSDPSRLGSQGPSMHTLTAKRQPLRHVMGLAIGNDS